MPSDICADNPLNGHSAEAVGEVTVKYGVVRKGSEDQETRITFNDPREVEPPNEGMRFSV